MDPITLAVLAGSVAIPAVISGVNDLNASNERYNQRMQSAELLQYARSLQAKAKRLGLEHILPKIQPDAWHFNSPEAKEAYEMQLREVGEELKSHSSMVGADTHEQIAELRAQGIEVNDDDYHDEQSSVASDIRARVIGEKYDKEIGSLGKRKVDSDMADASRTMGDLARTQGFTFDTITDHAYWADKVKNEAKKLYLRPGQLPVTRSQVIRQPGTPNTAVVTPSASIWTG